MISRRFPFFLVVLLLSASALAENVSFRFAPEDGSRWLRVGEDEAVRDLGAASPISESTTRQEVELLYQRQPDGGWRVEQTPRSISFEQNGVPTQNPILDLTIGHTLSLTLDPAGQALAAGGFRQLLRTLEDELPAAMFANVSQTFNEATMVQGEKARWNSELNPLRGKTVQVGEVWHVIELRSFAMGGGVPVEGVMRFEGWSELDGLRGFKVSYDWDNTGDAVKEFGTPDMKVVDLRLPGDPGQGGNVELRGKELRVIVPETGQLIYRTSEQVADLTEVEGVDSRVGSMYGHFEDRSVYRWRPLNGASGEG